MFAMLSTEAISAVISGVLVAVLFTLIAFLATRRSKKVDAVFAAVWNSPQFKMTRKLGSRIFLILLAAGLLLTFYNVWYSAHR